MSRPRFEGILWSFDGGPDCGICEDTGERNGQPCSCLSGSMVSLGREVDAVIEAEDSERHIEALVDMTTGGHRCEHAYNRCQYEDADGVTRCCYGATEERV